MNEFLISAESYVPAFAAAIEAVGGKQIARTSWIARWNGTADALCDRLSPYLRGRIVVCSLSGDWSYR